jgi:hypothetical protein
LTWIKNIDPHARGGGGLGALKRVFISIARRYP